MNERKWIKINSNGILARSSHTLSSVAEKVYIFGGEYESRNPIDSTMNVYDISSNKWESFLNETSPSNRLGHAAAVVNSKIYFLGGRNESKDELDDMWVFDTTNNTWKVVVIEDPKPTPRSYHAMESIGNDIYIFGGCGIVDGKEKTSCRYSDFWKFNTVESKWTQIITDTAPTCRGGPGLVKYQKDSLILLFGFNGQEMADCWKYTISQNKWEELKNSKNAPNARSVFSYCSLGDDSVFIFGGEGKPSGIGHLGAGDHNNDSFIYKSNQDEWKLLPITDTTPTPRGWHSCTAIDGGVALFGGLSNENIRLDDFYIYK